MKKLYLSLPVLFLIYWGCEDEKVDETDPLVGVWDMVTASIEVQSTPVQTLSINADLNNSEIMILAEDGIYSSTGKTNGENFSDSGTWSTTENKLTIMITNGETLILDFLISGTDLTLSKEDTYGDSVWVQPDDYYYEGYWEITTYPCTISIKYTK
jgi:hypothetical protein|tara:strand:- start:69 stop:536 length:468 start_codon:yes stop_codon:yes gene_type:complete